MTELTQEQLKEVLRYSPDTGEFSWVNATGSGKKDVPGSYTSTGYKRITFGGSEYLAHRLAWLYMHGSFPSAMIDHINQKRDDNRICNLRCVNHAGNGRNRRIGKNNTTGVMGVCWTKIGRWRASIRINNTTINLGDYPSLLDACCARKSAEIQYGFHKNHGRS